MDWYDVAQICLNGHVINDRVKSSPEFNKNFCDKCGEKSITCCPKCQTEIQGYYHVEGVFVIGSKENAPSYCMHCGNPFPWTAKNIELLNKAIDETDLDDVFKKDLRDIAPNLTTDTSESEFAVPKFKRILSKAGEKSQEMVENILAKAIAETLKSKYFG